MYIYKALEEEIPQKNIATIKDYKSVLLWYLFNKFETEIQKRKGITNIFVEFLVNNEKYITDFNIPPNNRRIVFAVYTDDTTHNRFIDYSVLKKYVNSHRKTDEATILKGIDLNDFMGYNENDSNKDKKEITELNLSNSGDLKIAGYKIEYRRPDGEIFKPEEAEIVLTAYIETY